MDYQLKELLQRFGLRNTPPRQAVFKLLKRGPSSSQELVAATSSILNQASVYRTLTLYRKLGVVQDLVIAGKRKIELTDTFAPHHHHISCSGCGKTLAINDESFEKQICNLAATYGYQHQTHSFEITGLCPRCA